MEELHLKYRPENFDEVIGHDSVVKSLQACLDQGTSRVFLLSGPSGTGKTTLGRIIASYVGTDASNIIEVDAATNSGVDQMRALTDSLLYQPFGDNPSRTVILDEVHRMTKQAWEAALKSLEEPPPNVYWVLCTTEADRVPDTIRTRTTWYQLDHVSRDDLFDLLSAVADVEGMTLNNKSIGMVVDAAMGSPRRALVYLSQVRGAADSQEVKKLLHTIEDDDDSVVKLGRMLTKGRELTWENVLENLNALKDKDGETVRLQILSYVTKVAMNEKNPEKAAHLLTIMDAFSRPYNRSSAQAELLLSFGQIVFESEEDE